jgi:hypothetical protein
LTDYLLHYLDTLGLLDLLMVKLQPTWRNFRTGDARVSKRLDRFLLSVDLVDSLGFAHQWVASGGESDHSPIVLELRGNTRRTPNPFKFFEGWLKDPEYQSLVHNLWVPIGPLQKSYAAILFMENLKKVKQSTILWAHEKRQKDDQELLSLEKNILEWQAKPNIGFSSREELAQVELRRRHILADKEALW